MRNLGFKTRHIWVQSRLLQSRPLPKAQLLIWEMWSEYRHQRAVRRAQGGKAKSAHPRTWHAVSGQEMPAPENNSHKPAVAPAFRGHKTQTLECGFRGAALPPSPFFCLSSLACPRLQCQSLWGQGSRTGVRKTFLVFAVS